MTQTRPGRLQGGTGAPPAEPVTIVPGPRGSFPLILLCVCQFVLQFDFSVVNIALRTIQQELHFSAVGLQSVATGYALTFGSLLLLGGRLGDLVGRRRLLLAGLWVFGLASLGCGLAGSPAVLVGARLVQGAGAAMVSPSVLAIMTTIYLDGPGRTRALGMWTGATAAGGMTGVVIGAVLTQYLGWQAIFLVNVPVIALILICAQRVLPHLPGRPADRLDALGAATVTTAIAALILSLSLGEQHGFGSPSALASAAVCVVATAAFIVVERTVAAPMVPFGFLAVAARRVSLVAMFVIGGLLASYAYFVALYLQRVLGMQEVEAALLLLPSPILLVFVSILVSRRIMARIGPKPTMILGLCAFGAGQLVFSQITPDNQYALHVLPALLLGAFGMALVMPAAAVGISSRATDAERGLAAGLIPTAQQIGSAVCLAVLVTIAAARTGSDGGSLLTGYRTAFLVAALLTAVTVVYVAASDFEGKRR